jgi:hypothetical protein
MTGARQRHLQLNPTCRLFAQPLNLPPLELGELNSLAIISLDLQLLYDTTYQQQL